MRSAEATFQAASAVGPGPTADGREVQPITAHEFALLRDLIHREAGIYLSDAKVALLTRRLGRRLRELGLTTYAAYYRRLTRASDGEERLALLDAVATGETQFFREPWQFDFLVWRLVPAWEEAARARRRLRWVRAWSAGCSTGEELYFFAMVLLDQLLLTVGWEHEVLAIDLFRPALA